MFYPNWGYSKSYLQQVSFICSEPSSKCLNYPFKVATCDSACFSFSFCLPGTSLGFISQWKTNIKWAGFCFTAAAWPFLASVPSRPKYNDSHPRDDYMFTLEAGWLPVPSHRKKLLLGGVPLEKHHKSGSFSWVQTHDGADRTTQHRFEATERETKRRSVCVISIFTSLPTTAVILLLLWRELPCTVWPTCSRWRLETEFGKHKMSAFRWQQRFYSIDINEHVRHLEDSVV